MSGVFPGMFPFGGAQVCVASLHVQGWAVWLWLRSQKFSGYDCQKLYLFALQWILTAALIVQFGGLGGMPAQAMTQQVWFGFHYTSRSQVL